MLSSILALALALLPAPALGVDDLTDLLPSDGVPTGWAGEGRPRLLEGEALYTHINGGAELFLRNGFERLAVRDYRNGDLEIRIEIYDLGSAAGASAVFAENSYGAAAEGRFGDGSSVDPLQVIFHRGRHYVTLTCYEISDELQRAMACMATRIDDLLLREGA